MAYLKLVEVDILPLPSDSAYVVKMKRSASYGDVEGARSAMLKMTAGPAGVVSDLEWKSYIQALTVSLILDWNLTDEMDHPLAISTESLNRIDPTDGDFLAQEAQKRMRVRPQAEEVPFEKPSGTS